MKKSIDRANSIPYPEVICFRFPSAKRTILVLIRCKAIRAVQSQ